MKKNGVRSLDETNRSLWDCISNDFNIVALFFAKEEGGGGEQNPQGIEDNEQLDGEQGSYFWQLLIFETQTLQLTLINC